MVSNRTLKKNKEGGGSEEYHKEEEIKYQESEYIEERKEALISRYHNLFQA